MTGLDVTAPELSDVARVLAEIAGLSLGHGLRTALREALLAAAAERDEEPIALARRVIAREGAAVDALLEHAVVPETAFWRHPEQLAALGPLLAARPGSLTIWSAGCASGEEAYSVAAALLEAGRAGRGDFVLATDVSERALAAARRGRYGARALRKLPVDVAERRLLPADDSGGRTVSPALRALVAFERHNLVADPLPAAAPFDVVLCRNVLIYFEPGVAAAVLHQLWAAVKPGGVLVLGPVELPLAAELAVERRGSGAGALLVKGAGLAAPG